MRSRPMTALLIVRFGYRLFSGILLPEAKPRPKPDGRGTVQSPKEVWGPYRIGMPLHGDCLHLSQTSISKSARCCIRFQEKTNILQATIGDLLNLLSGEFFLDYSIGSQQRQLNPWSENDKMAINRGAEIQERRESWCRKAMEKTLKISSFRKGRTTGRSRLRHFRNNYLKKMCLGICQQQ